MYNIDMKKQYAIQGKDMRSLVSDGRGCIASDRITVDGMKVGYMYRDSPHNELDSGWRFLAGDESDEYMSVSSNHDVYALNTIANYDPDIIPFLDMPEGVAFERTDKGLELIRD